MQEILDGPERRRRWSDEQKVAIVVEAASPDMTVSQVARRHGLSRQQIYQWRSAMRRGQLVADGGGPFLAVEFVEPFSEDPDCAGRCSDADHFVEIALRKGRVLRVPVSISRKVLTGLIQAAEAA